MSEQVSFHALIPKDHPLQRLNLQSEEDLMFLGTRAVCHLITSWQARGVQTTSPIIGALDRLYTFSDPKPVLTMLRDYQDFSTTRMELTGFHQGVWYPGILGNRVSPQTQRILMVTNERLPDGRQTIRVPLRHPNILATSDLVYLQQDPDFANTWARAVQPQYLEQGFDPAAYLRSIRPAD
jgi:hypothetical protein